MSRRRINRGILKRLLKKQAKVYKEYKTAEKKYNKATAEVQRRLKTLRKATRKK